jgi:hypothetical protein
MGPGPFLNSQLATGHHITINLELDIVSHINPPTKPSRGRFNSGGICQLREWHLFERALDNPGSRVLGVLLGV